MACNVLLPGLRNDLRNVLREDICIISCYFQNRTHTVVCSWVDAGRINLLLMMLSWPTTTGLSRLVSIGILSALTTIRSHKMQKNDAQLHSSAHVDVHLSQQLTILSGHVIRFGTVFFHPTRLTNSHTDDWIKSLKRGDLYVLALWGNSPCGNNTTLSGFISQNETSTRQMMSSFSP